MRLSEGQTEIVESDAKHILVVAGAGCGKTTTLVEYAMRHLGSDGDPRQMVLAFSNRAANDVRLKIDGAIEGYSDRMFVGTIHQFCMEVIRRYGNTIGLRPDVQVFELEQDRIGIMREAVAGIPERAAELSSLDDESAAGYLRDAYRSMSRAKKTLDLSALSDPVCAEYDSILSSMNAIDFDDIILDARRILVEQERVARTYRAYYGGICVDEAQDLNPAQYELIKALAGDSMRVMMIGDPKQAIFGFAGASPDMMCRRFVDDFRPAVYELSDNYRSSRQVVRAAKLIDPRYSPDPHVRLEGAFELRHYRDEREQAEGVAGTIARLLSEGHPDIDPPPRPEGICVLARNRYLLEPVKAALDRRGIECTARSSADGQPFESVVFKAAMLGARVIANPSDTHHLLRLNELLGMPPGSGFPQDPSPEDGLSRALASIWAEMRRQNGDGSFEPERYLEAIEGYRAGLSDEYESELVSRDEETWRSMVDWYVRSSRPGGRSLRGLLTSAAVGGTGPVADRGVVLSTVHLAKGLEFDAVFVICVNEGVFPSYHSKDRRSLEEETHSMFVAVTRSRRLCYVSYVDYMDGKRGPIRREPSRFVAALSKGFDVVESDSEGSEGIDAAAGGWPGSASETLRAPVGE